MPYCKWGPEYRLLVYGDTSEFFSSPHFFTMTGWPELRTSTYSAKTSTAKRELGIEFEHGFKIRNDLSWPSEVFKKLSNHYAPRSIAYRDLADCF